MNTVGGIISVRFVEESAMKELIEEAARRSARYLAGLDERSVAPPAEAVARLAGFDVPLQEEPIAPMQVLAELDRLGSPATVASAGPRYFGFVTGGTLPAALAANVLAGAWDQNAVFHVASPTAAVVEEVCRRWLAALLRATGRGGRRFCDRGHHGQLQCAWRPRGTRCWTGRGGTSRRAASSGRRR